MIYRDGLRTHPFDLKNTVGYNGIMDFYVEKKQAIIIGLLVFGLLAGGAILWRQNGAGFLGANLSRALGGAGGWTEIKPRVANSTGTPAAPAPGKETKSAKAAKPAPVEWCRVEVAPPAGEKSIIFNEIAWMGTVASYSDEWMELKNVSGQEIDLNGWQIQNKNQKIKISFGENEILLPAGLYLLERTDDESAPQAIADKIYKGGLANTQEGLYLFDANCRLQDAIVSGAKWPAGDNASKKTMIRLPDLRWQTSAAGGGTPRAENK